MPPILILNTRAVLDIQTLKNSHNNYDYEMMRVSQFIRDETGTSFYGTKMMVAEWNSVPEYNTSLVSKIGT